MAEFKTVSGQMEGIWNRAMVEAEAAGRKAGEAAATERVLQVLDVLIDEWRLDRPELVTELRRRLSVPEPVGLDDGLERLTFEEWEERARREGWAHALDPVPVPAERVAHMTAAEWEERNANEVGAVPHPYNPDTLERRREAKAPLVPSWPDGMPHQDHPGIVPASPAPAGDSLDRGAARAAAAVYPPPDTSATAETLRQTDLERERSEEEVLAARVAGGEDDSGTVRSAL